MTWWVMPDERKREGGGRHDQDPPRLRVGAEEKDEDRLGMGLCPPLSASLSWENPAPFASTVDVDAIKVC